MPVVYRSVLQRYSPSKDVQDMFAVFLSMVNDSIRLGLQSGDPEFKAMKEACYPRLMEYEIENSYRVAAIFEASNLLKKYRTDSRIRRTSRPRCRNPFLSASVGVRVEGDHVVLPGDRRIPLTPHTTSVLSKDGVKVASVTLTPRSCTIVYCRPVKPIIPGGAVAVDLNLDNLTTYDTSGKDRFYDLRRLTEMHETYRRVKAGFRRNDYRMKGLIFRKYADIEWNKKTALIHNLTSSIVKQAAADRQAIVMEDLRGLRTLFKKESGSSRYYLSKMNAWPYAEIQRQLAYKGEDRGLRVIFVGAEGSSSTCSKCGGLTWEAPGEEALLVCRDCGLVINRHVNAARNLLTRGMRSVPDGSAEEAMTGTQARHNGPNAGVDADHSPSHENDSARGSKHC